MAHIVYSVTLPLFALYPFLFSVTELEQTAFAFCFLQLAPVVLIYVLQWLSLTWVLYDPLLACPI